MTKLDFLKDYSPEEKWKTWQIMGSQSITLDTKFFIEGVLYKINVPNSKINGSLVYCKKELIDNKGLYVDWESADLVGYDSISGFGKIAFNCPTLKGNLNGVEENQQYTPFNSNLIISPNFDLILNKYEIEKLDGDKLLELDKNNFIPFESTDQLNNLGRVHISNVDYENCLKCLGYPFITEDELEYSRKDILNYAIKPALEEYFHWIPLERIQEYPVTGSVQIIDFPSDAYDVLGVSVQQRGTHGSGNITNTLLRFFDEASYGSYNYSGMTGNYKGTHRPRTAQSGPESFISNRAVVQATTNLNTRVHFDILNQKEEPIPIYEMDENNNIIKDKNDKPIIKGYEEHPKIIKGKFLRIYSNKLGTFNVHWAIQSLDFDDVEYQQRQNVFKYCQAEIKELFGNLRRQAKSDIPGAVDYSTWLDEAKTMKEEVVNDWKQLVKASSIIRGSL